LRGICGAESSGAPQASIENTLCSLLCLFERATRRNEYVARSALHARSPTFRRRIRSHDGQEGEARCSPRIYRCRRAGTSLSLQSPDTGFEDSQAHEENRRFAAANGAQAWYFSQPSAMRVLLIATAVVVLSVTLLVRESTDARAHAIECGVWTPIQAGLSCR
jgi:hypothetical protein